VNIIDRRTVMRLSTVGFGAAVTLVCAALALPNNASAVDLRDWGKKYPVSERFVVLPQFNNQAVLDKETQLVWERQPATAKVVWDQARQTCAVKPVGGRSGWRLAALNELTSLYDDTTGLPTGHPFVMGGPFAAPFWFWTATVDARSGHDTTWTFEFTPGSLPYPQYNYQFTFRAWCVRAAGPIMSY
jgi:Protein of unknown function (DUF1566)